MTPLDSVVASAICIFFRSSQLSTFIGVFSCLLSNSNSKQCCNGERIQDIFPVAEEIRSVDTPNDTLQPLAELNSKPALLCNL